MYCHEISEELSAYIDGELTVDRKTEIEVHLIKCSSCQETLELLRATSGAFQSLSPRQVSSDFSEKIQAGIDVSKPRSLFTWQTIAVPVALAASLVLVFFLNQDAAETLNITDQLLAMELESTVVIPETEFNTPCLAPKETGLVFGLVDSI